MKKSLIALTLTVAALLSVPSYAYKDVYEPESDTSVSYSTYSLEKGTSEVVFSKLASKDGLDQYWIRLSRRQNREKLLHYMILDIDGEQIRLTASAPTYWQENAATSTVDNEALGFLGPVGIQRTPFRYFNLSPEIVQKIMNANHITIYYSRLNRLNMAFDIDDKFLQAIKKNFSYAFSDFESVSKWHPDLSENKKKIKSDDELQDYRLSDVGVWGNPTVVIK